MLKGSFLSFVPGLNGSGNGPYMGGTADEQEQSNVQGARMAGSDSLSQSTGGIRVKTLADQRKEAQKAQQGAEFYIRWQRVQQLDEGMDHRTSEG